VAVADAAPEVLAAAAVVTKSPGGRGAVRELVEMILKEAGSWETILARYRQAEREPT
jgi:3-deoxy-D-manno-octulosonate 8-phosphate phosphatase (KDO 8-P phosphatase)